MANAFSFEGTLNGSKVNCTVQGQPDVKAAEAWAKRNFVGITNLKPLGIVVQPPGGRVVQDPPKK